MIFNLLSLLIFPGVISVFCRLVKGGATSHAKTSPRMNGSFGIAPPYNIFVLHAVTAMMIPRKYGKLFKQNEYSCSYLHLWGCLFNTAGRRFSEGIFEDVGSRCSANVCKKLYLAYTDWYGKYFFSYKFILYFR